MIDPSGIVNQGSAQDVKVYVPAGTPGIDATPGGPQPKVARPILALFLDGMNYSKSCAVARATGFPV